MQAAVGTQSSDVPRVQSNDKLPNKSFHWALASPARAFPWSAHPPVHSLLRLCSCPRRLLLLKRRNLFAFPLLVRLWFHLVARDLPQQVLLRIRANLGILVKRSIFFSSNCLSQLWIANNRSSYRKYSFAVSLQLLLAQFSHPFSCCTSLFSVLHPAKTFPTKYLN